MQNVKNFASKNLSIESSLTMAAPSDSLKNENVFLIGLNFNGKGVTDLTVNNSGEIRNKIPMLMLKIDADKIISAQSSNGKENSGDNGKNKEDFVDNRIENKNPIKEIYSFDYNSSENKLPHENLSFREMQVMKLIALGKARKEIAEELFLSISTINTYRSRILEKMNMKNNAEIMRYAFQHKLVE